MKRSPMPARKAPLRSSPVGRVQSPSHRAALRPVSRRRQQQMRLYLPLRDAYLAVNPWCQSPAACGQRATDVHHRRGREGARLLDVTFWAASCRACNSRAETDTGWALATGWLLPATSITERAS